MFSQHYSHEKGSNQFKRKFIYYLVKFQVIETPLLISMYAYGKL